MADSEADSKPIKSLIQSFFDAINASDTKALQEHFFPTASLTILRQDPPLPESSPPPSPPDNKITVVTRTNIETFIKMVEDGERRRKGKKGPELVERPDLEHTRIEVDAGFGMAWSPFTVTFDGVLHHYGVMVYTLGREEGGKWRIEGLTQSYRRTPGWEKTSFL
ncbi:hypothetical protein NA57DRAFT_75030 [Rhizodiscina lignyota]|uniref:Uncharacterized protein n=1 Tax=Rhizodiscina lignyota TaxID=1504668 RepID=A0A9P4IDD9_9PEZI|nr:hypothetical protein NA57DRAFT_75030 [Rhizodiscina lignyota]